jgi:uncharacterized protein
MEIGMRPFCTRRRSGCMTNSSHGTGADTLGIMLDEYLNVMGGSTGVSGLLNVGNHDSAGIQMKIWVDADACPRVIKEIIFRASERLNVTVCLVANTGLVKHTSRLVESVVVDGGFDAADDYIVNCAASEDLVITADIPLAARLVAKGCVALDPRGDVYTEENVGERLSMRDLMMELRSGGLIQGGPAQFSRTDRQRFASSLDRLLTRMRRGERPA